jgi:hypothetical protein
LSLHPRIQEEYGPACKWRQCALAHEFDRLPVTDSNAWLSAHVAMATVTRPTTIADLYAIRDGRERRCTTAALGFDGAARETR